MPLLVCFKKIGLITQWGFKITPVKLKLFFKIIGGRIYICDEIKNKVSDQAFSIEKLPGLDLLTHRELEIITLIKNGQSSREIAASLKISLKTVETHRHNILKKLELKNVASLVNFINENQL